MGKRILFRVDAGQSTGLGHYFRSLNLAKHLQARGHFISFVHRPSEFWKLACSNGIPFDSEELGSDEEQQMLNLIKSENFDLLYVDGILQFSREFISGAKKSCKLIFYQNLCSSMFFANVFILPTLNYDKDFLERFTQETKVFKGLEYFLFHEKISFLKSKKSDITQKVRNVAITSGGSDPKNILLKLYEMIHYTQFPDIEFNFYFGEDFMNIEAIPENPMQNTSFLKFNHEHILNNDLLISVFGVSTYEFLALGMPTITVAHQESNSQSAEAVGEKTQGICHLGLFDNLDQNVLNQTISRFCLDKLVRTELVRNATRSIDLKGIERVIKIIENV